MASHVPAIFSFLQVPLTACTALCLFAQGAVDTLLDWRLTVRPPLLLRNTLPVGATYAVWERSGAAPSSGMGQGASSGSSSVLRCRQQGRVGAGQAVAVHTVDMRQQVRTRLRTSSKRCFLLNPFDFLVSPSTLSSLSSAFSSALFLLRVQPAASAAGFRVRALPVVSPSVCS